MLLMQLARSTRRPRTFCRVMLAVCRSGATAARRRNRPLFGPLPCPATAWSRCSTAARTTPPTPSPPRSITRPWTSRTQRSSGPFAALMSTAAAGSQRSSSTRTSRRPTASVCRTALGPRLAADQRLPAGLLLTRTGTCTTCLHVHVGAGLDSNTMGEMMAPADTNKDGMVDLAEFKASTPASATQS